jgi:hypothetical protein
MAYRGKYEGFEALSAHIFMNLLKISLYLQGRFSSRLIRKFSEYFIGNVELTVEISLTVIPKVQRVLHRKCRYS